MNTSITYKLICSTLSLKYPITQRSFCQHMPISSSSLTRIQLFDKKFNNLHAFQKAFIFDHNDLFPQTIKHILLYIVTNLHHMFSC